MPDNINDILLNEFTKHTVNLSRVDGHYDRIIIKYMRALRKDIIEQIKRIDPTEVNASTYRLIRLKRLLEQVNESIKSSYRNFRGEIKSELIDLSSLESEFVGKTINAAINAELVTVGMPRSAVRKIVNTSLIQGSTVSEWMATFSRNTQKRIQDQMRMGVLAGETVQDLVVRIRGRSIPGKRGEYVGGVINTSTNEARAFVRTAANTLSNKVREQVFEDNSDLIKGMQALVTLDLRTSDICKSRSGMAWDLDGNPLPGTNTTIPYPGPPPWHWNCRSTLIPVLKSLEELGARTKVKVPQSSQASMDGQVSGDLNYEAVFKEITR